MTKRQNAGGRKSWCLFAFALAICFTACGGELDGPRVGSESHFLRLCDESCEDPSLDCISGLCSQPCLVAEPESCSPLAEGATCTNESVESGSIAVCDVFCTETSECRNLGADFFCDEGFCRAPILLKEPVDLKNYDDYQPLETLPIEEDLQCQQPISEFFESGELACKLIHSERSEEGAATLDCLAPGLRPLSEKLQKYVRSYMAGDFCETKDDSTLCSTLKVCEVIQLSGNNRKRCLDASVDENGVGSAGFCFIEPGLVSKDGSHIAGGGEDGTNALVEHCRSDARRAFRYVGLDLNHLAETDSHIVCEEQ